MNQNSTEVVLGGVVLALAIGFFVYAGQIAGLAPQRGGYDLHASFRSAEGVSLGTDVRLAGVRVGSVTGMQLNPQTFMADLRFTLQDGLVLPEDTAVIIASEGLLGGTFIELFPGGSPFDLEPGGRIEDTQGAVSLATLLFRFVMGSEDQ